MMDEKRTKTVRAWCLYDWANSAFATTVMAAVLPIYFHHLSRTSLPPTQRHLALSLWGYTAALSMLCVAVLALVLGPYADQTAQKKRYLGSFTFVGALASCLLPLVGRGHWEWISLLFIVGMVGFSGGEVFYDALLPHVARSDEFERVSTRAYAWGYLGGGLLLALNVGMIAWLPKQILIGGGDPVPLLGMRLSLFSAGLWWGLFSVPLFRHVGEPQEDLTVKRGALISISFHRLLETFSHVRRYRSAFLFLVAFWFYNDGIGTIIKMATVYGSEVGIRTLDMVGALLLTQAVGIPSTLWFGRLAGKIGPKKAILLGLGVYGLIIIGGFFMATALHFWMLAFGVGLVQGGTQALSRSLYAHLIPKERSAEFFGFYNISGKFAGVVGPALFGLANQFSGNSRYGILSLLPLFLIGGMILTRVPEPTGKK